MLDDPALKQRVEKLQRTLLRKAPDYKDLVEVFEEVCRSLVDLGLEPERISLVLLPGTRSLDGRQFVWRVDHPDNIETLYLPAGFAQTQEHRQSVLVDVMNSAEPMRIAQGDVERLEKYPFISELFSSGVTDYVAVPLRTRRNAVHVLSVATFRDSGWTGPCEELLMPIAEVLALLVESFEVQELFEERDLMLRELNHRVKNNVSMSSSLLRIQARQFDDEVVVKAFNQSAARLDSVAMVHAQLYARDRLTDLELGAYAKDLVDGLVATRGGPVRVHFDVEMLFVRVEQAVPMALILNELVTNALKHGSCREPGSTPDYDLRVTVRPSERGVRIKVGNWVRDGWTSDSDKNSKSFGKTMMDAFSRRLDCIGSVETDATGWYEVDLDFGIRHLLPGLASRVTPT